jgi:hypothetical protein
MLRIFDRTRQAVEIGFAQALGVQLPDTDHIARLVLAYLYEAAVRGAIDPEGADAERFAAYLRRLIVLDVRHQNEAAGLGIDPARLPTL